MKKFIPLVLSLFVLCLFACQNDVSPRQGLKRAAEITVVEETEFGHLMKGNTHVELSVNKSTKYFNSSLEEITCDEFDEKDHFYVYYVRWYASCPAILHVIYMYES